MSHWGILNDSLSLQIISFNTKRKSIIQIAGKTSGKPILTLLIYGTTALEEF
jgi:hypothetical protein